MYIWILKNSTFSTKRFWPDPKPCDKRPQTTACTRHTREGISFIKEDIERKTACGWGKQHSTGVCDTQQCVCVRVGITIPFGVRILGRERESSCPHSFKMTTTAAAHIHTHTQKCTDHRLKLLNVESTAFAGTSSTGTFVGGGWHSFYMGFGSVQTKCTAPVPHGKMMVCTTPPTGACHTWQVKDSHSMAMQTMNRGDLAGMHPQWSHIAPFPLCAWTAGTRPRAGVVGETNAMDRLLGWVHPWNPFRSLIAAWLG